MVVCSVAILLTHYFVIYLSSDLKLSSNSLQKKGDYKPERALLIVFAMTSFFRFESGGNFLDLAIAGFGLSYCIYQSVSQRTFADYRLRLLNGLLYSTGLWILLCYHFPKIAWDAGKPLKRPIITFLLGYIVVLLVNLLLRPRMKLVSLDLSDYGHFESERFLHNIQTLVDAYTKSAHKEAQTTLMDLFKFVSREQTKAKDKRSRNRQLDGLFSFFGVTRGDANISPEAYAQNFLKSMLQYVIQQYQRSITYFEDNIDLRIGLSYILNDLALQKNEALATAEFCSTLEWNLKQGIEISCLLRYLEEEEVSHDQGIGV